jgi:hypothetical protein
MTAVLYELRTAADTSVRTSTNQLRSPATPLRPRRFNFSGRAPSVSNANPVYPWQLLPIVTGFRAFSQEIRVALLENHRPGQTDCPRCDPGEELLWPAE